MCSSGCRQIANAHGWPSRVRANAVGENAGVRDEMERVRGLNRGSFILGHLVHSWRIRRLWVDLQRNCTGAYPAVFQSLEDEGHLDVENQIDMFCLHWCYLPQLEAALHQFHNVWNNHLLRSRAAPYHIAAQSWLAAKEAGISLELVPEGESGKLDDEDPKVIEAAATNYVAYGTEARLAKDPRPSGPAVEVTRPMDLLPSETAKLLQHPFLRARLDLVLGPAWPVGDDLGSKRFLRCKETVQEWLDHCRKAVLS